MAGYAETILAKYAKNIQPLADQIAQAQAPAPQVPDADGMYRIGVAASNQRALSDATEMEDDLLRMSAGELFTKYGTAAGSMIASRATGYNVGANDRTTVRNGNDVLGDSVTAPVIGAINTVGGLTAWGAGQLNAGLGTKVSGYLDKFNTAARDSQSDALNTHRRYNDVLTKIDTDTNAARYENDRQSEGDLTAKLRQIGRDALSNAGNVLADPMLAGYGVLEGGGSLLVGGAVGKTVGLAGSTMLKGLLKVGVLGEGAAVKAAQIGSKLKMPVAIGGMEAGGVYTQTVNQVMGMKHEQLLFGSPEYAELIRQRMDPVEAQQQIAHGAANMAAMIQFPIAAATGALTGVGKFEANPTRDSSIGHALGDMAKETLEEGLQSATGQLTGNAGVRAYANQDQDITEGVGESLGLGALYGLGSAGVVQTPGIAAQAVVGAGKAAVGGTVAAGKAVAKPFMDRLDRITSEREAASPVSAPNLNVQAENVLASVPEAQAQVEADIASGAVSPEQGKLIQERMDTLARSIAFDPAELDNHPMDDTVKSVIGSATNRFDALHKAATLAGSTAVDVPSRISAALYINDTINQFGAQLEGNLISAMDPLADEDTTHLPQLRAFEDVLINIQENPEVQSALRTAQQYVAKLKVEDVSEAAVATPKGQQAVQGIISVAQSDIGSIDPDLAEVVLQHARNGRISLKPSEMKLLDNSVQLNKIGQTYSIQAKKLELKPQDIVSKQIRETDTGDDVIDKSAAGHFRGIMASVNAGNMADATTRLNDMMLFAQHMQNKVQALNENLRLGNGSKVNDTKYQALGLSRKWQPSLTGMWLNPKAPGSVKMAQLVSLDAKAVVDMANQVARSMPELGVQPLEPVEINPAIVSGPARMVAKKFQLGQLTVSEQVKPVVRSELAPETS